jgi:hypothetical protein
MMQSKIQLNRISPGNSSEKNLSVNHSSHNLNQPDGNYLTPESKLPQFAYKVNNYGSGNL